jgi:hypothetical protein
MVRRDPVELAGADAWRYRRLDELQGLRHHASGTPESRELFWSVD